MAFLPNSPNFEVIGASICCGWCYFFYKCLSSRLQKIECMKAAPILRQDSIVNQSGQVMLAGTTGFVHGTVKPVEGPGIQPSVSPNASNTVTTANRSISGVYSEKTLTEMIVSQLFGIWSNNERIINVERQVVPFFIVDGFLRVQVQNPIELESVSLQVVGESYESPTSGLLTSIVSMVQGFQTTGIKHTEEMLLTGTEVVGLGRLVLKTSGFYLEADPSVPYIISSKSKEQIIELYQSYLPYLRLGCWISGVCALLFISSLVCRSGRRAMVRWREAASLQSRQLAVSAAADCDPDDLPPKLSCITCCRLRNAVLVPCAHVAVCLDCVDKLRNHCPVCRAVISSVQPLIFS